MTSDQCPYIPAHQDDRFVRKVTVNLDETNQTKPMLTSFVAILKYKECIIDKMLNALLFVSYNKLIHLLSK